MVPQTTPRLPRGRLTAVAALWISSVFAATCFAQPVGSTVVASNLNNPRGLDFAPNGALFIAEAGSGGDGPQIQGGDGAMLHFGLSGSVTRVFKGTQERIVTGLPSLAASNGGAAIGPSAISFGQNGNAAFTIGLGQNPAVRARILGAAGATMGTLWQLNQNGQIRLIADIAGFEATNDPDGHPTPDSNPNGVLSDKNGVVYVADAGGNSLVQVSASGKVSLVAVFPNRNVPFPTPSSQFPMQAVPTNVVRGPDGALYVSQLTGFPFPPGAARIYRVVPGSAPTIYAEGFTNIIDLEFDAAGNLYVLEIDKNGLLPAQPPAPEKPIVGRLARINASDHSVVDIATTGLVMPGGMAIGPDGAIYVSNYSTASGAGQVIRIQP